MATLPESSAWPAGIYQLERSDPVQGGTPNQTPGQEAGRSNWPLQQLANRTRFLRDRQDAMADSGGILSQSTLRTAWLASGGSDATAAVGDPTHPFASAQAAFIALASLAGTEPRLLVVLPRASGTYGAVSLSASLTVHLVGFGPGSSIGDIESSGDLHLLGDGLVQVGSVTGPLEGEVVIADVRVGGNLVVPGGTLECSDAVISGSQASVSGTNGSVGADGGAGQDAIGIGPQTAGNGGPGQPGGAGSPGGTCTFRRCHFTEVMEISADGGGGGSGGVGGKGGDAIAQTGDAVGGNGGDGGDGGPGGNAGHVRIYHCTFAYTGNEFRAVGGSAGSAGNGGIGGDASVDEGYSAYPGNGGGGGDAAAGGSGQLVEAAGNLDGLVRLYGGDGGMFGSGSPGGNSGAGSQGADGDYSQSVGGNGGTCVLTAGLANIEGYFSGGAGAYVSGVVGAAEFRSGSHCCLRVPQDHPAVTRLAGSMLVFDGHVYLETATGTIELAQV